MMVFDHFRKGAKELRGKDCGDNSDLEEFTKEYEKKGNEADQLLRKKQTQEREERDRKKDK